MMPRKSSIHWLGWLCASTFLCAQLSCGKGHVIVSKNLVPPTLDGLPTVTNQTHLAVHGTRVASVEVWVTQGATDVRLAPAANSTDWTGAVDLQQGLNTLFAYVKDGGAKSTKSNGYTVLLDTTPPGVPTVNAPDAVNVGSGGSISTTISGTKDPDASIVINGNVVVPIDGLTAWTTTVTVTLGDNTYNITAVDLAGNASPAVSLSIYGSTLDTPIILVPDVNAAGLTNFNPNDKPFYTNNPNAHFVGSKQGDTDLYFVFNGGAPQDLGFFNTPSWDHNFHLGADGTYTVGYQVQKNGTLSHSGTAQVKIMLKTTRPTLPTISSPRFPVADTGDSSITLTGTLPSADSYLCVSATSDGPCLATSSTYGGGFSVAVPLTNGADGSGVGHPTGDNPLYISARDVYGNISDEIAQTVYRVSPPQVVMGFPTANATIMGSDLPVILSATAYGTDATHSSALIASVRVCFDLNCVDAAAHGSGNYTINPNFDLSGVLNGTSHTLTVTVTDSLATPLQTVITEQLLFSDGSPIWVSAHDPNQDAQSARSAFDSAGNLHVVWSDFCSQVGNACPVANANQAQPPDIFYAKRSQATGAWSAPLLVSAIAGDGHSQAPSLAIDAADNIHIAWYDDGPVAGKPASNGIVHRVLSNIGTLNAPVAVGSPTSGVDDVDPSLGFDATGGVHLAFTRHTSGSRSDIVYARYTGGSWSAPLLVTTDSATGTAERPSLYGVAGGKAHVAWQECRVYGGVNHCITQVNRDIYLREVSNATTLGFGPLLVSDTDKTLYDGDSLQPSLVVDGNSVDWVFWSDTAGTGSPTGSHAGTSGNAVPSNIWLQQYQAGVKVAGSLSIVSNDSSTNNANGAAEQPMASLGPVVSGDAQVAVAWTQSNPGNSAVDIATKSAQVSAGTTGLLNATMAYADTALDTAQQACVALNGSSDLFVVWTSNHVYGAANPAGVQQIFFQLIP